jgi:hypothetical protein
MRSARGSIFLSYFSCSIYLRRLAASVLFAGLVGAEGGGGRGLDSFFFFGAVESSRCD